MQKKNLKSGCQDKNDPAIATDVIEDFCNAIVDSPELYPHFMKLSPHGLRRMCTKLASYITRISNKNIITPADTEFLKKIHQPLNIDETSYTEFTRLFAHVCCRNKNDSRRKKMLSTFSLLKAHICPFAGGGQNFAAFCGVLSNVVDKEQGCWLYSFPEPSDEYCCRSTDKLSRSEVWNEQAQFFHLRKRLRRCEKLITVIQLKSKRMEMRISKLEEESKYEQFIIKRKRDLDLICN